MLLPPLPGLHALAILGLTVVALYLFTMDFVRVGVPLTIILWLVLSWLLTTLYPL